VGWARRLPSLRGYPGSSSAQRSTLQGLHAVCVRLARKFLLLVRWPNRKSTLGTRVNPPPNPDKGCTETARHQSTPPQRFNPFGIGR